MIIHPTLHQGDPIDTLFGGEALQCLTILTVQPDGDAFHRGEPRRHADLDRFEIVQVVGDVVGIPELGLLFDAMKGRDATVGFGRVSEVDQWLDHGIKSLAARESTVAPCDWQGGR